ncbi:MAG: hypothetical protein LQ337_003662 [Flavoplaca oasis]|nr:MAG: hypothetical protein LQ337_003662 [Flavoplaca oasis]
MAVKKEPRLAGKKQPLAAAKKQLHVAAKKKPFKTAMKQPHATAKKEPLAAAKKQLLVAAKKKPFVAAIKQPLATAKKELLVAAKKQLLVAARKQPLATTKKSLYVAWNKEPCAAAKKKPCAVVKEEPCAAVDKELCVAAIQASGGFTKKGKRFGRKSHSLETLETIPEEEVLVVEKVSARAEGKQHMVHCNEKLPDLRELSKHAFLVLEEAMGTVPYVQDIVADSLVSAIERTLDRCLRLESELGDEIERRMVEEQATILHQFLQEHTALEDRLDVKEPGIGMHTAITQATERGVSATNAPEVAGSQQFREECMKEVQLPNGQKQKKKQISEEQIKKPPVRMRVGKEQMKEEPVKKKVWRL